MKPHSRRQSSDHPADVQNLARLAALVRREVLGLTPRRWFPTPGIAIVVGCLFCVMGALSDGGFTFAGLFVSSGVVLVWLGLSALDKKVRAAFDGNDDDLRAAVAASRRYNSLANQLSAALHAVHDGDADRCPPNTLAALETILRRAANARSHYYSPRLALSILSAMEHLATAREMSTFEWIAQSPATDPPAERLRAAARHCIAAVHARMEREREGETLLRAAAPTETGTLLRPAHGDTDTDPGLLLRPARDEERPVR